ncbi:ERF family protein [Bradyrhizobium japonicum]|uniref:ERF family protein n=1 Tax=Bradyrhizobium japonicum TaxID=375 RepID=UPI00200D1B13|nr:ERF family protein [Bradyrhizobium japonicum]UQD96068.1 ERF family protein [Bradyrhizobium japonicum]
MNNLPATQSGYHSVIERAALDPNFDVDKLERLVSMQEAQELRSGDRAFNEALSAAEAEMATISTNANNPQTRSRYATFARLDGEVRPIYTKHGFGISWNTEPMGEPNVIRVVGMLSNGIIARRFQVDMPIVTQGLRGGDMMTRTHATMSAISYGKRQLEIMMFNLAIGDDDDGNKAGGPAPRRPPPPVNQARTGQTQQQPPAEVFDPDTGEVIDKPMLIKMTEQDDFGTWGQRFLAAIRSAAHDLDGVDQFVALNHDELERMRDTKPAHFDVLRSRIDEIKQGYLGNEVRS